MSTNPTVESFTAASSGFWQRLQELIREGNVRRVTVMHEGRSIAEFPLTAGVVGVVFAPILAAVGAVVALVNDCTIEVERESVPDGYSAPPAEVAA